MNEREKNYTIMSVIDILRTIWKYKYIVVSFVIVAVIFTIVQTKFFTPDTYTASGIVYVSSKSGTESDQASDIDRGDIESARTLSTTYIETLKIRPFLNSVSSQIGNEKYPWYIIKEMLNVSPINGTELLSIKITADSADSAYSLLKSIMLLAPETLSKVTDGGRIEILDEGEKPKVPDDKGLIKKIAISGFVGGILALILIFILTLFDTKIRRSEDVEGRYNFSILGIIENWRRVNNV